MPGVTTRALRYARGRARVSAATAASDWPKRIRDMQYVDVSRVPGMGRGKHMTAPAWVTRPNVPGGRGRRQVAQPLVANLFADDLRQEVEQAQRQVQVVNDTRRLSDQECEQAMQACTPVPTHATAGASPRRTVQCEERQPRPI